MGRSSRRRSVSRPRSASDPARLPVGSPQPRASSSVPPTLRSKSQSTRENGGNPFWQETNPFVHNPAPHPANPFLPPPLPPRPHPDVVAESERRRLREKGPSVPHRGERPKEKYADNYGFKSYCAGGSDHLGDQKRHQEIYGIEIIRGNIRGRLFYPFINCPEFSPSPTGQSMFICKGQRLEVFIPNNKRWNQQMVFKGPFVFRGLYWDKDKRRYIPARCTAKKRMTYDPPIIEGREDLVKEDNLEKMMDITMNPEKRIGWPDGPLKRSDVRFEMFYPHTDHDMEKVGQHDTAIDNYKPSPEPPIAPFHRSFVPRRELLPHDKRKRHPPKVLKEGKGYGYVFHIDFPWYDLMHRGRRVTAMPQAIEWFMPESPVYRCYDVYPKKTIGTYDETKGTVDVPLLPNEKFRFWPPLQPGQTYSTYSRTFESG